VFQNLDWLTDKYFKLSELYDVSKMPDTKYSLFNSFEELIARE